MNIYEELFSNDQQISKLMQENFDLNNQNVLLKKTIHTLVHVKCKRGESNVHLNTDLHMCIKNNKAGITIRRINELLVVHKKPKEIVIQLLLNLLIGDSKQSIPCVLLDNQTVLYKRVDVYNAVSIEDFSLLIQDLVQDQLSTLMSTFENEDIQNVPIVVEVINMLIQDWSFTECFRKTLKKYSLV
jgi:hypothetical protein